MIIARDTKLKDLLSEYPWLKDEMSKVNDKFKMLSTPICRTALTVAQEG